MISQHEPLTAVIISGAVARGAYEAAAMAELLPKLLPTLKNTFFLGTSAGAINAALWARFAEPGRSVADVGAAVRAVWERIDDEAVFSALPISLVRDGLGLAAGVLFNRGLSELFDTTALRRTVTRELDAAAIARNLAARSVAGVGVVATFCGATPAGDRAHLFLQGMPRPALKAADSGIDYLPATLAPEHILASSAVPVLFEPIAVDNGRGTPDWYIDGGVRLNTPIAPAIALGAKRIIVISSHTAEYSKPGGPSRQPKVNDSLAQVLHSVLADGMIEDLRRLKTRNAIVQQAQRNKQPAPESLAGRTYEAIPFIVVAPQPGQLARAARAALNDAAIVSARAIRYRTLDTILRATGAGSGRDEILSYVFFDPDYFKLQFKLGEAHARATNANWRMSS